MLMKILVLIARNIKAVTAALVISTGALAPQYAVAQIPVTDGALITTTNAQWVKQLAEMLNQINMLRNQWNTAQATLKNFSDPRNIGKALLSDPTVMSQFPPGTADAIRQIQAGGINGASSAAKLLYMEINKVPCKGSATSVANCQATGLLSVGISQSVDKALTLASSRAQQLQKLVSQVDSAIDSKDTADLSARIAGMQTQMAADTQVVTLAIKLQEAQLALAKQRQLQSDLKEMTTPVDVCYVCR